jgi:hypothetical protein
VWGEVGVSGVKNIEDILENLRLETHSQTPFIPIYKPFSATLRPKTSLEASQPTKGL